MEEDWELLDKIPKFTVGEGSNARTFWSQMSCATAILSQKTDTELQERSKELNATIGGDAPSILQDWKLNKDQMSGTLDGRTVWFVVQVAGHLEGSPQENDAPFGAGGYVEAVGGRVYEVGIPREPIKTDEPTEKTIEPAENSKNVFTTSATAFVSALAASAILAAATGFGAGLSIGSEMNTQPVRRSAMVHVEASTTERRAATEARVLREERVMTTVTERLTDDKAMLQKLRSDEIAAGTQATIAPVSNNGDVGLSLSEKRARAEARVLREERMVDNISQQLTRDSAQLQELKKIEKLMP